MKLRTRLLITFFTIVILPLLLTVVAFIGIGFSIKQNAQQGFGTDNLDVSLLLDPVHGYSKITEKFYQDLENQIQLDQCIIENPLYLDSVSQKLKSKSSFLIIRKDSELFYTGNPAQAEDIFSILPAYGVSNNNSESGFFYSNKEKLIRQIDFKFNDDANGSLFIVTSVSSVVSPFNLKIVGIIIITILIITSSILTKWIQKGVFKPIRDLNIAMQNISEGNLEYSLFREVQGEIGDLYSNYEQMRLRLKESGDEKLYADKQNRELVSNISHDLKTPITSIKGYVEGIMDGVADTPEKMEKYIKTIYNKTNDMDKLINELMIYSKIDSNRIPYHFHKIIIADYFNDCIEELGLDLNSKTMELHYSNLVDPETAIIADPEQLKRVINNIISNCVKYIDKEKGIIDIRILDEVDSIRIEIEDNGKGVSAKELGRIFERFYRTDASRNSAQGGSGIGLSIVKKIIEDHGGYIWATSKENEGTCMHIVIRKYKETEKGTNYEQNIDY